MTSAINRLADATIELTITIPWVEVKTVYDHVVDHAVENTEITGFRKGKAPRNLVENKLDKSKIYEEVLKELIPKVYNEAATAQKIKPIVTPKVELKEASENKDWVLRLLTCERPTITLKDYKTAIKDLKASKGQKIWTPGQEPKPDDKEQSTKPTLDELLKTLYDNVDISLPSILTDQEINRLLSELIDQTKKLGLTVEQYLTSTGRNADTIRNEYSEQAKRSLTLEFALEEIADKEAILVSDDDIDTVIKSSKTDEERKALSAQRYYLASVLRRQKTLDFLSSLS
jgi:trigger factor